MHARVAAFENRDVSRTDELVALVRDRLSAGGEIPDALGMYMLVDRAAGTALGIGIFESEDAIQAAEPIFERMGDEVPEEVRGKRTSVDIFEVAIHEVADEPAAARISMYSGDPASLDEERHVVAQNVPDARTLDGWKGMIMLVDRTTGASRVITLWESEDALAASEERAGELREQTAKEAGQQVAGVERYEVAMSFDRAPRLAGV
jgi:heme-degrading monooxygenase HmoA